eukprot:178523-Pyramimonas_sp.AAC.1
MQSNRCPALPGDGDFQVLAEAGNAGMEVDGSHCPVACKESWKHSPAAFCPSTSTAPTAFEVTEPILACASRRANWHPYEFCPHQALGPPEHCSASGERAGPP